MSSVETGPTLGPCTSWVTEEDVAACCGVDVGTDTALFTTAAVEASMVLFELSGRQFPGQCEQTVRPCASGCACWDYIISPAQSPAIPWAWGFWGSYGWAWGFEGCGAGDTCGCGSLSRALLQGYPVNEIIEVKIDGITIDGTEYRLDDYRWLTRMADAAGNAQFWPSCQRLDLNDDQPGTWSVTYLFGQSPPLLGVSAAAQLACEIYRACSDSDGIGACALPSGVTKITRQGVTIERSPFVTWAFAKGQWGTGLPLVDMFLSTYNPAGLRRRPSVWSPDVPPYGLRTSAAGS